VRTLPQTTIIFTVLRMVYGKLRYPTAIIEANAPC